MSRKQTNRQQSRTKKTGRRKPGVTHKSRARARTGTPNKNQQHNDKPENPTADDASSIVLLFNKPFQVLCQFTDQDDLATPYCPP